ncbi:phage major capsid protein [Mycobacterium arosiense]|uniref:Capsid protein n=1 Tax=Mycobacterium arosiense ATCC BAA-1401 = DSM 45069 TaxID=1265311 RepID=A0A1W9ZKZ3_MYCAI|nr:phage major capsid protein [Mycobacterium arosiense]ORA17363.1 capsid protein [Mycobacterium arosiense ATCC BAA-1401 = DSM 45069]
MSIAVPSGNASAINDALAQAVIGPLQEKSTFLSLPGIHIIDTAAPLRLPLSAATSPNAAFTAPGATIAQQTVALTEKVLLPTERVGLKSLTVVSNELVRMAQLNIESVLTQRIVEDQALVLDAALWNGAGTSDSITGVLAASGISTSSSADLLTDPDVLIDALAAMAEEFVTPSVLVMRPTTFAALRKIKVSSSDSRYVFDPSQAFVAGAQQLFNLPVVTTTAVPANAIAVLDTSFIYVGRDIDSSTVVLDQTFGDSDSIGIRSVSRYDVVVTRAAAVNLLTVDAG